LFWLGSEAGTSLSAFQERAGMPNLPPNTVVYHIPIIGEFFQ
jgi:hypothetical protein